MKRVQLGLWAYLALIVSVIVGTALVAYGVYGARERLQEAQAGALEDAQALGQTAAASTAHFLITGAYDGVEQTLLRLARLQRVKSIELFDPDARMVSAVVVQEGTPRASFARRAFRIPSGEEQVIGEDRFTVVVPIERGSVIGWVRVETDTQSLRTIRTEIWIETAVLLLLTLALTIGGLAWGLRRAVRPLTRSTAFAESLTQRRGQQLELASPVREVASLAQALNRLSYVLREEEAALRASELRKSAILEASMDCLLTIDDGGRIVEFNPASEQTFGYRREEAVGQPMSELIVPPRMRAAHEAGMKRYLATGDGPVLRKRLELTAVDREGREFPVELAIVPCEIDGRPYFAGYLRDISEQKATERARAEAAAALHLQTEQLAIGQAVAGLIVMDWDIAKDELTWSGDPEWLRGPLPASGKYPVFKDQVHPDDLESFLQMRSLAIATLAGQTREYRVVRTDGAIRWVDSRQQVFVGADGKATRMIIALHDITERKRVTALLEGSLRELENQKAALDEHAIVSITDRDGVIVYANDKFVEVSGYPREQLIGQNHRLVKSGLHPPELYRDMWDTIGSGRAWHGEIANRSRDGSIYWVASTIVPLLDAEGKPHQYIAIRTDITRQKSVELALSEARARELETGHAIQQSLLLGEVPRAWPLEIAAFAQPSQGVDGDFYEFFAVHGRSCDVLVGDVMGKGVTAALMGAGLKHQYGRALSQLIAPGRADVELPRPGDIINKLHRGITADLIQLDAFITLAYCRIDLRLGRLSYIGAGHPPAVHVAADGTVSFIAGDNLPLGIARDERYVESERPFDVGDLLLLYSDGVTEARNAAGEEYGQERLAAHVESLCAAAVPPAIILQSVRRAVSRFTAAPYWADDFTIIAFLHRDERQRLRSEEFQRDLSELTRLRRWVEDLSAAVLPEEAVQRLVLAAVEIASNIVRHADVPVRAAAYLCHHEVTADRVRVDFYYLGKPYDRAAVAPPDFSGGRDGGFGLYIVEHSVDEFAQAVLAEDVSRLSLAMRRSPGRGAS